MTKVWQEPDGSWRWKPCPRKEATREDKELFDQLEVPKVPGQRRMMPGMEGLWAKPKE